MTLQVIGAGMGRTGTESLRLALEMLGVGPCHHMFALRDDASLVPAWLDAVRQGTTPDFDTALAGFSAQVDWPGGFFWQDLIEWAPEAKVILSLRDFDGWYASMQKTILPFVALKGRHEPKHRNDIAELVERILAKQFDGQINNPDHAKAVYDAHVTRVRATVPADRLLELPIGAGWQPLCAFLDKPIPKADYPSGNTTKTFTDRIAANLNGV